jgi:hypothetical protein
MAGMVMEKKGQVAIFVIVGIMIVVAILVFFLWARPTYLIEGAGELNFEKCVEDVVEQGIGELEGKAGFAEPEFTYAYSGEGVTYLCYTAEYYDTCTVQVPFLKNSFEKELGILIRDGIDECYGDSLSELRGQGYSVEQGDVSYDILIEPGIVRVEIDAPTVVGSASFARFNVGVNSPLYDMLMIATSILQFETRYGDSDVSSIMLYYPDLIIDKLKQSDGTTVYIMEHKTFGNKFKFASRSLVFPAGYVA